MRSPVNLVNSFLSQLTGIQNAVEYIVSTHLPVFASVLASIFLAFDNDAIYADAKISLHFVVLLTETKTN